MNTTTSAYDVRGDLDLDGDVDTTDKASATAAAFGYRTLSGAGNTRGAIGDKYHVPMLGLIGHRRREASSTTGRWLTRDPTGYPDGVSLYEVCVSNTIIHLDPFGETIHARGSQLAELIDAMRKCSPTFESIAGPLDEDPGIDVWVLFGKTGFTSTGRIRLGSTVVGFGVQPDLLPSTTQERTGDGFDSGVCTILPELAKTGDETLWRVVAHELIHASALILGTKPGETDDEKDHEKMKKIVDKIVNEIKTNCSNPGAPEPSG